MIVRPILKWAGAKNWAVPHLAGPIIDYLQRTGGYFVEPFLGSASMALAIGSESSQPMALSDILQPLIEFYEVVRERPGEVAWQLSAYGIEGVGPENYYRIRDLRPEDPVQRAARLLFLNRLGFNGLYRENKAGEFNVPYGDAIYRKSIIGRSARDAMESLFPNKERIHHVAVALRDAELFCGDFQAVIDAAGPGDLVYADPPYDVGFDAYSKDGFTADDQERLAEALWNAAQRGAAVVAHNALTERVFDLYDWCEVTEVAEKRSIAANGSRRQRAACGLMTSGISLQISSSKPST